MAAFLKNMSSNEEGLLEYIIELLEPVGKVEVKRMFGSSLFKVDGVQLGVLVSGILYFSITDAELQYKYKNNGSKQFSYIRKDKKDPVIIKNWWSVPDKAMDSSIDMVKLAEEVLMQKIK